MTETDMFQQILSVRIVAFTFLASMISFAPFTFQVNLLNVFQKLSFTFIPLFTVKALKRWLLFLLNFIALMSILDMFFNVILVKANSPLAKPFSWLVKSS